MQRIMIIGGPGSGKSTLARALVDRLDLPVVHMDPIYWKGDWILRDPAQVMQMARTAADASAWVFDGNHSRSMAYRAERADLIVMLDMPRSVRMWRVLWRSARFYGRTRPDMGPNCPERFDWAFLKFCWNYQTDGRLSALQFVTEWSDRCATRILRSRAEVEVFLTDLVVRCPHSPLATPPPSQ
ncbi:topology modulation protein [Falsiruegeria litorea R37]|uniref:Topology modulation protein n=1 Tax=Falsiruegeria litorea R37 TaxID=1200284 RepID=A0A1Y5RWQ2_9RHOB|nr:AAA family ATPase [Falsiruegeria litorea]SLN24634.1 topology modulation protein [Falsiruegeria litorea R37]